MDDSDNPLYTAVRSGQVDHVRALLAAGGARYLRGSGCTLLHLAARRNYRAVAWQLLYHGADVDARDGVGRTPLHVAASWGSTSVIKRLLVFGADVRAYDDEGNTPLLLACHYGMAAAASLLLDGGAPVNQLRGPKRPLVNGETPSSDQYTPLHAACQQGDPDVVRLLLKAGARVNGLCAQGCTPLMLACQYSRVDVLQQLVDHGADATIPDNNRWTPLRMACELKCVAVLKCLLRVQEVLAAVDAPNHEGTTPLYLAAKAGFSEGVSLLVTAGANPHPAVINEFYPLYAAICHGWSAVDRQLLAAGAHISGHAPNGVTLLHTAIERKQPAEVARLLRLGADPDVAAADGTHSLHAAVTANQPVILGMLLAAVAAGRSSAGVDAEAHGETALQLAVKKKLWACVRVLVAAGADSSKLYGPGDWEGAMPLHCAVQQGGKRAPGRVVLLATPTTVCHIWKGQTPLHLALTANKAGVARALVEAGAPPGLRNNAGATALSLAARHGNAGIREMIPAMVRSDCKLFHQEQQQQQQQRRGTQARNLASIVGDTCNALRDLLAHRQLPCVADCIAAVVEVLGAAAASSLVRQVMLRHNTPLAASSWGVEENGAIVRMVHRSWMAALQPLLERKEQVVSKLQRLGLAQPKQVGHQGHDHGGAAPAAAAAAAAGDIAGQRTAVIEGLLTQCLAAASSGQWADVVEHLAQLAELQPGQPERLACLNDVLSRLASSTPDLVVRNVQLSELCAALVAAWSATLRETPANVQFDVTEAVLAAVHAWQIALPPRRRRAMRNM